MSDLSLTPQEQAYFDTAGQQAPEAAPEAQSAEPVAGQDAGTQQSAPDVQQQPQQQQTRMVPHEALHEERERRKEAQRELEQARAWRAELERRFAAAQQAQQAPPPSFDDNPVDAAKYGIQQTAAQVDEVRQTVEQLRAAEAARQVDHYVSAQEQQFTAKQPDYYEAVNHLQRMRQDTYRALGATDDQIGALLEGERRQLLQHALTSKQNVPQLVYQLAKTWGYQPRQGGQQQPDRIATLQAGQRAAVTLGALPGTSGGTLTAQALAEMSDSEFAATLEKNPNLFRKVMGG